MSGLYVLVVPLPSWVPIESTWAVCAGTVQAHSRINATVIADFINASMSLCGRLVFVLVFSPDDERHVFEPALTIRELNLKTFLAATRQVVSDMEESIFYIQDMIRAVH